METKMAETVHFQLDNEDDADQVVDEINELGAQASIEDVEGIVPLAVLLAVVIPPGAALLAKVVNRIVERWRKVGVLIDARDVRPPVVQKLPGTPFGTVVILTKDGQRSERSDIAEEDLGDYVSKALG